MANKLKNNWLVKNDGSNEFVEVVVKYLNINFTGSMLIGNLKDYYY